MDNQISALAFNNITMDFPGVKALDDVSFQVNKGEIHALMGANGAGKSTLIKILARVYQQTSGDILLDGESLKDTTAQTIRDKGIDFIFQELELVPGFTVAQNIMIGIEPRKGNGLIDWKKMRDDAQKALDEFMPGVIDARQQVGQLSVAKQQIVSIVRAGLSMESGKAIGPSENVYLWPFRAVRSTFFAPLRYSHFARSSPR